MKTELFRITLKPMSLHETISIWCVEPLYNGVSVGICFWFAKYSLAKFFCNRFKSQHTFYFWQHFSCRPSSITMTLDYVFHLLESMSYDERVIFQYS